MTLLIVFLAITNLAVGYGLAVYLGKSNQPIQISLGRLRKPKAEVSGSLETTGEEPNVPVAVEETSVPVEASGASDSSESESAELVTKIAEPGPTPPVEAASSAVQEEEKPLPQQVPQLDVSDLMPGAQPSLEATNLEVTKPEETSDKPKASQSDKETVDEVEQVPPPGELASAGGGEASSIDREDASDQVTENDPSNDPIEVLNADPIVKPEAVAKEPKPEEPKPEEPDELESLAQMLQIAVAESSDEDNDDAKVAESASEVTTEPESSSSEESAIPEEILSGLESFQQQLQQQSTPEGSTTEAESTDDAELEPEVLAGIEAFRTQLAHMKDLPPSVSVDESVEEPETTASI